MPSALIMVHPYREMDKGVLEGNIKKEVSGFHGDTFLLDYSEKDPSGLYKLDYDYRLVEDNGTLTEDAGEGAIKKQDALEIVTNYDKIFVGGGYLRRCMSNSCNRLIMAAEHLHREIHLFIVGDLTYVNNMKQREVLRLDDAIAKFGESQDNSNYLFEGIRESDYVNGRQIQSIADLKHSI